MSEKYNKLKVIRDIILFKLKYKDVQKAREISDLYNEIYIEKHPITIKHFKLIKKYDLDDVKKTIDIHNKYVINKADKIDLTFLIPIITKIIVVCSATLFPNLNGITDAFELFANGKIKAGKF